MTGDGRRMMEDGWWMMVMMDDELIGPSIGVSNVSELAACDIANKGCATSGRRKVSTRISRCTDIESMEYTATLLGSNKTILASKKHVLGSSTTRLGSKNILPYNNNTIIHYRTFNSLLVHFWFTFDSLLVHLLFIVGSLVVHSRFTFG